MRWMRVLKKKDLRLLFKDSCPLSSPLTDTGLGGMAGVGVAKNKREKGEKIVNFHLKSNGQFSVP